MAGSREQPLLSVGTGLAGGAHEQNELLDSTPSDGASSRRSYFSVSRQRSSRGGPA